MVPKLPLSSADPAFVAFTGGIIPHAFGLPKRNHVTESGHRWSCSEVHTTVEVDKRHVA
jgi:hypothetical protein